MTAKATHPAPPESRTLTPRACLFTGRIDEMRSLVGDADRGFAAVEDFAGPYPKRGDLEGAVVLEVNGVTLLDTEMWDSVDLLWALLVRGVREFLERGEAKVGFPDQPTFLAFRRSGTVVFFEALLELSPPNEWKYREQLRSARAL